MTLRNGEASRLLEKDFTDGKQNLECADNGGALDFSAFRRLRIQSGVALRLPPHSKYVFQQPARVPNARLNCRAS